MTPSNEPAPPYCAIVGTGRAMTQLRRDLNAAAKGVGPVFLVGETGTGKELVAKMLHLLSRPTQPFVAVNCAGLPAELVEGELFGYRKGAYTGAVAHHGGLVAAADGGVLFLDEVTEMPLGDQAKLLRLLDEGLMRPVGSTVETSVDVRFVSSTNRLPTRAVEAGLLRHDLYHRLNVHQLRLPSLRERLEDIPALVQFFAGVMAGRGLRKTDTLTKGALRRLKDYHWPGNVRELRNVVERALSAGTGTAIEATHLPEYLNVSDREMVTEAERIPTLREAEMRLVQRALKAAGGNKVHAARILGISRNSLYGKLRKFELAD